MKSMVVILKVGRGNWTTGFPVTLQIAPEGGAIVTEVTGSLPPHPSLLGHYQAWQKMYQTLHQAFRISGLKKNVTPIATPQGCTEAAQTVQTSFQEWLTSASFRSIREMWLEKLSIDQPIQVILQTDDAILQGLPWHLWDLLQRYPNAELALASPAYDHVESVTPKTSQVSVLAILGNSQGIDTQVDLQVLHQISDLNLRVLTEPTRSQLSDALWEHHWDILFFAGHSISNDDRTTGQIYINPTDSLTLSELKYALQRSVQQGLCIAIFNSCDGLGLASELATLKIPELLVMREPVPDRIAQKFLKYFLTSFANGQSLYLSIRQARERLQALESDFPCATWLPILFQNPAYTPPTWKSFVKSNSNVQTIAEPIANPIVEPIANPIAEPNEIFPQNRSPFKTLIRAIGIGLTSGAVALGLQATSLLKPLEHYAYDRLLMARPAEPTDDRILIITIDEADLKAQSKPGLSSLSDDSLNQLLIRLQAYEPDAIGLDIYRDFPASQKQLQQRLKTTDSFISVCKTSTPDRPQEGVEKPPEVPIDRMGFSDFIRDSDGILRRQLLFMNPAPTSLCQATYGLATRLAIESLLTQEITPSFTTNGELQLGRVVIPNLANSPGIYRHSDTRGGQLLLNYRTGDRPFETVSLTQVLKGQINPAVMKHRIILIGVTAVSAGDLWTIPATEQQRHGVMLQAQMTSQLVHHVLNKRPLIWASSLWIEGLWMITFGLVSAFCLSFLCQPAVQQRNLKLMIIFILSNLALIAGSYTLLLRGNWLPIVAPMMAIGSSTLAVAIDHRRLSKPLDFG